MKKCESCSIEIAQNYRWCSECVKKYYAAHPRGVEGGTNMTPQAVKTAPKAWHDDPVVSALLQLNSNMGYILKELKRMNDRNERLDITKGDFNDPPFEEPKESMIRTKSALDDELEERED